MIMNNNYAVMLQLINRMQNQMEKLISSTVYLLVHLKCEKHHNKIKAW